MLVLSPDKTKVRRIVKALPELRTKKLQIVSDNAENQPKTEGIIRFVPCVYSFHMTKDMFFKGRAFEKRLKKCFPIDVPFAKTNKKTAYLAFNELDIDVQALDELA